MPVAQGALADLAAITLDNFIERQEHWLGHVCPLVVRTLPEPRRTIIFRGLILAASESELNDPPSDAS
jgi:hypothetical protein